LSSLGPGGVLLTLGYSAGRKTTIDVTDLIWKGARMAGFSLHHLMNDRPFGKVVLERISKYQQPSASRGRGCGH